MLLALSAVTYAGLKGRLWLHASVVILLLVSAVTAGKIIVIFGYATSAATPIYAGIFLATDALSEIYGKIEAKKAIWLGFFAHALLLASGYLISVATPYTDGDSMHEALNVLFSFIPLLVLGGFVAFFIAQQIDIFIFHWLKKRHGESRLWLRNNVSTLISQFVDSTLVYFIAFYGKFPNLWELVITAWIFKIIVAAVDTPFIYAIRKLSRKE